MVIGSKSIGSSAAVKPRKEEPAKLRATFSGVRLAKVLSPTSPGDLVHSQPGGGIRTPSVTLLPLIQTTVKPRKEEPAKLRTNRLFFRILLSFGWVNVLNQRIFSFLQDLINSIYVWENFK